MVKNNGCSLSTFERNKYFYSKLLTVRDFELEQRYGIEKNHLINRLILGEGIVCGLEIELKEQQETDLLSVSLTPGVALDRCGCEIVVSKTKSEQLEIKSPGKKYIYIEYDERSKEPVADLANGSADESEGRYNRIEESYSLSLSSEAPPTKDSDTEDSDTEDSDTENSDSEMTAESLDELVRQYHNQALKTCSRNKYDQIPLAVVDISEGGEATLNEEETQKYRPVLRSNPMLYDLLSHVYDLTKEAIATPRIDANSFISSDESITITPTEEPQQFDFTLASGMTEPSTQNRSRVFTGKEVLELTTNEELPKGSLQPVTVEINELNPEEPFSVMLAPLLPATVPPVFTPTLGEQDNKSGLRFVFGSHPELPRTYVAYVPQPYNKSFEIHGCDPNLSELDLKEVEVVYWVIAGAKAPSLRDRILELLANNPEGMTMTAISRELDVERSSVDTELDKLVNEGAIERSGRSRYILVE
ncbi:helix-turn-helix domain-containing protein [Mastigocoleus testarum]|uniref:HTH iclR-type domain-containing protein n=1 Tax=Mastigocoleus testarum BC008 TaxID=371196 RepID=A0A0V7ZKN9_9CYAN|nr:helix-turn-helix domain-containing protein [Mastigocoleus testarum]KST62192.1 hypothetical protein BC008_37750 [Mastigocoleus testarum BC008]KST64822.1 hypothetical protein BC008_18580 [Mastigocoleus testarum BC008]